MKLTRFFLIVLYAGYLVNAGLLLVLLPWSRAWGILLSRLPPGMSTLLDTPWFRGALSAFGALHLMLVAWELINPTLLAPQSDAQTESQNNTRS